MNFKCKTLLLAVGSVILVGIGLQGYSVTSRGKIDGAAKSDPVIIGMLGHDNVASFDLAVPGRFRF